MKNLVVILICFLFPKIVLCVTQNEIQRFLGDWLGGEIVVGQYDSRKPCSLGNDKTHESMFCTFQYLSIAKAFDGAFLSRKYSAYGGQSNFKPEDKSRFALSYTLFTYFDESLDAFVSVDIACNTSVWAGKGNKLARIEFNEENDWLNIDSLEGKYKSKYCFEFSNNGEALMLQNVFDNNIAASGFYEMALSESFKPDSNEILARGMANFYRNHQEFSELSLSECVNIIKDYLDNKSSAYQELCEDIHELFKFIKNFSGKWNYEVYDDSGKVDDSGIACGFNDMTGAVFVFRSEKKSNKGIVELKRFFLTSNGQFVAMPKIRKIFAREGNKLIFKGLERIGASCFTPTKIDLSKSEHKIFLEKGNYRIEIANNASKEYTKDGKGWKIQSSMTKQIDK